MALPLNQAFVANAIAVFWNNYQQSQGLPPYLGTGLFPSDKLQTIDLKWIKGSRGLPVSLTPSNYDALATVRDRIGFKEIETEMPFFRESYLVKEKDAQEYDNYLNSADPALAQQVLKQIMLQPSDLINGANVVPERMIWQLLAPIDGSPKIAMSANGVPVDYNYDKDGVYKANNFVELSTATDKWTDTTNSDPYEDMKALQKAIKTRTGVKPTVAVMNDVTFQLIVKNAKIHNYLLAQNATANPMVTEPLIKLLFQQNLGLEIVVYDLLYKNEAGESKTFIPDYMVSMLPSLRALGTTYYGKTPEERSAGKAANVNFAIVNTGVAVYTYETPHPIIDQCIVSEIVLPSYEQMDYTGVLKVA